jgi:hypothetical protein
LTAVFPPRRCPSLTPPRWVPEPAPHASRSPRQGASRECLVWTPRVLFPTNTCSSCRQQPPPPSPRPPPARLCPTPSSHAPWVSLFARPLLSTPRCTPLVTVGACR